MIENLLSTLRKNSWLAGVTFCMAMIYSCEEDMVESRPQLSGDEIVFSVATDSTWQAMGTASSRAVTKDNSHFLTALGEDSLYISMVEEENHTPVFVAEADSVDSRGASLLSTSFDQFKLTAFLDVDNTYSEYMMNQVVTRNTSSGECSYSPVKYWPADKSQSIHFFGYAQSKETPAISPTFTVTPGATETYTGTFSYTLPEHTDANKDAEAQSDLVFAITPNQNKESGTVNFDFQHALSAVVFKIGNVPDNVIVNTVTFENVYAAGDCEMKLDGNVVFSWSNPTDVAKKSYSQTLTTTDPVQKDQDISTVWDETCFMMVPQTLPQDAKLVISITVNGRPYTLDKELKDIMTSLKWEANKKYTYIISLPDEVKVNVDDDVDAAKKIKSGLEIKNTGLSPIYVRVAIIGNWKNETTEQIVADWRNSGNSETDDGEFDWGGGVKVDPYNDTTPVRNWLKGSDGFYYYTKELARGKSVPDTDKLFDTYQLKVQSPPVPNAVLDLTIAVQAMRKEDLQKKDQYGNSLNIWPSEITTIIFND